MDLNCHSLEERIPQNMELPHPLYFWKGIQPAANKQNYQFSFTLVKTVAGALCYHEQQASDLLLLIFSYSILPV